MYNKTKHLPFLFLLRPPVFVCLVVCVVCTIPTRLVVRAVCALAGRVRCVYACDETDGYPQISRTRGAASEGALGVGHNFEGGGIRAAVTAPRKGQMRSDPYFQIG